jgi:hypothetical protein
MFRGRGDADTASADDVGAAGGVVLAAWSFAGGDELEHATAEATNTAPTTVLATTPPR